MLRSIVDTWSIPRTWACDPLTPPPIIRGNARNACVAGRRGHCLLAGPAAAAQPRPAARRVPPKLVVLIVVDQMRADYVDAVPGRLDVGPEAPGRPRARGSPNAAYPYLDDRTCAGHATIATGAFPHTHGIFQNAWFDRRRAQRVTCTEDRAASHGVLLRRRARRRQRGSASRCRRFADEMRRSAERAWSRCAQSPERDHDGRARRRRRDVAASTAPTAGRPPRRSPRPGSGGEGVRRRQSASRPTYGKIWNRLLPPARYHDADAGEGEAPPRGWTVDVPARALAATPTIRGPMSSITRSGSGARSRTRTSAGWRRARRVDGARQARRAPTCWRSASRARHRRARLRPAQPGSAGHVRAARSDDRHAARRLDALVGRGRYVVGLSSDHGVADIPEQIAGRAARTAGG